MVNEMKDLIKDKDVLLPLIILAAFLTWFFFLGGQQLIIKLILKLAEIYYGDLSWLNI